MLTVSPRSRLIAVGTALATSVLVTVPAAPAQASVYLPCKWHQPRVKVFISGYPLRGGWHVTDAMRVWNSRSVGQPRLVRTSVRSSADMVVRPYHGGSATDTVAYTKMGCVGLSTSTDVFLNVDTHSGLAIKTKASIHEFGHVLGLDHRCCVTIMRPRLGDATRYPSASDWRYLDRRYS